MPPGMTSHPYNPPKDQIARLTLCELCDRTLKTQDWPAHKNSKKHRALEDADKAKENKGNINGTNGWEGEGSNFTADDDSGFNLAPQDSGNDTWGASNNDGRGSTGSVVNTSGYGNKSGGGGGDRACFGCGEVGHNKRDCPKGGSGGDRACFGCGQVGHNKRDCPQGGSGGGGQACFNCGMEG